MYSYNNIGGKLKGLSKTVAVIGGIGCALGGIVLCVRGGILPGLLMLVLGPVFFYVDSWLLYAFGTLVENTQRIADKLTGNAETNDWICPKCNTRNSANSYACKNCCAGRPAANPPSEQVRHIIDNMTREPINTDWICPECNTPNPDNTYACKKCCAGRPAPKNTSSPDKNTWICPYCQTVNPAEDDFCFDCNAQRPS